MKLSQLFCLALATNSAFCRLQGHHRRHTHGAANHLIQHIGDYDKRSLINVGGSVNVGPLDASVGLNIGSPGPPHNHGGHPGHPGRPGPGPGPHPGPGDGPGPGPPPHPGKPTAWDQVPKDGKFCFDGFGNRTDPNGEGVSYKGNVGDPWGSNIITVKDGPTASTYKYVMQIHGPKAKDSKPWTIVFWNKIGPDGAMTGWYGNSALNFTLHANEIVYVAFDENSQGAFAAAPGDPISKDQFGGYSSTWGEFDFADTKNKHMSGWDVSCIQAQKAKQPVQGLRMCLSNMDKCSTITKDAKLVENAYDSSKAGIDGLSSTVGPGPVRLIVEVGFTG